jgi:cardiolipin synthase
MTQNVPIALTWLRIILIPVFVAVYYLPDTWLAPVAKNWTAMSVFAVAAITDWLDGYLARRWGVVSAFGAFLDPVADKLMVAAALILLVALGRAEAYLAIIIIGREIAISALREWMAQLGKTKNVAVAFIGKVKTAAQMTAIIALLLYDPRHSHAAARIARVVDRRDPHAVVDVPLSAPRSPASRRAYGEAASCAQDACASAAHRFGDASAAVTRIAPDEAELLKLQVRFPDSSVGRATDC